MVLQLVRLRGYVCFPSFCQLTDTGRREALTFSFDCIRMSSIVRVGAVRSPVFFPPQSLVTQPQSLCRSGNNLSSILAASISAVVVFPEIIGILTCSNSKTSIKSDNCSYPEDPSLSHAQILVPWLSGSHNRGCFYHAQLARNEKEMATTNRHPG